ncbi:MAG: efflux RND transporter periplasmic adaptor subunit [Methylococcales bacterium]|nr:efflux RND transporter periplasmic adaptor subunit [Methylococcales bacterium]
MCRIIIKKSVISLLLVLSNTVFAGNGKVLDCVLEPSMVVELSSQVRGVIENIYVERTDVVKNGQLVANLMSGVEKVSVQLAMDRSKMVVDIKSRKAEQKFRKHTFEQVKELYRKKLASQREYEDAKTSSIVADIELEKAIELKYLAGMELKRTQEILKLRSMHSMIDGVVVDVMKSPGEFVEEQPVMKIAQIDPLFVEVIVPETLMGRVKVGKQLKVNIEIPIAASHLATVSAVDQIIDATSGTFGVRLILPNPDNKIHAGQRCQVVLVDEPLKLNLNKYKNKR